MSEKFQKIKKKIEVPLQTKDLEIKIDNEIGEDAKGFRMLAGDLAEELQKEGILVDSSKITKSNFRDHVRQLAEAKAKTEQTLKELEEKDFDGGLEDNIGKGGAGSVKLREGQQNKSKKTFNSRKELAEYVLDQEHRTGDTELGDKLFSKWVNSVKRKNEGRALDFSQVEEEYKDDTIIEKMREKANADYRRKLEGVKK